MPDRGLATWETSAPFITMLRPGGVVEVWVHGEDRFRITARGCEQVVVGFPEAERIADELAAQLE